MITFFKDKETEKIFNNKLAKKLSRELYARGLSKLVFIDKMTDIKELMTPPSNKLEKLKGNRDGQWSVRINQQYRLCFYWNEETCEASEVELVDYHK
ncbi:MAG: type II toxin-antitoxin system RelE/ParE family toxin [Alphaproteobacteria bacterium]|nr:type II toxin-antitoxin system RelE/ParE family toxin [Alphaproteobacteria bacterium]